MRRAKRLLKPCPDNEHLAWAAGFWDGEGCVLTLKRSYNAPQFVIGQAGDEGPALCQRFLDSVGIDGRVEGPYLDGRRVKPYYMARFTGYRNVEAVVERCWPWLSETKRAQWERAKAAYWQYREDHVVYDADTATACRQGHERNEENTYLYRGARRCRVCHREYERERLARKKAS